MGRLPKILLLSKNELEAATLQQILDSHADLSWVRTLTGLKEQMDASQYDALFCGWSFHRTRWKNALELIRLLVGDLPVIFLSRSEAQEEWREVIEAGGFDLLAPPYRASRALSVLHQALESYEARSLRHFGEERETKVS